MQEPSKAAWGSARWWGAAAALVAGALVVGVVVIATRGETIDPFVFHAGKRVEFERAGAAGESHLLYANSPRWGECDRTARGRARGSDPGRRLGLRR